MYYFIYSLLLFNYQKVGLAENKEARAFILNKIKIFVIFSLCYVFVDSHCMVIYIKKFHNIIITRYSPIVLQSTLDISNCQGTNKFVRDIESSTYRVVILCKLIRMGPIVLLETSRVRLIEYSRYRDSTVSRFDCISYHGL